MASQNSSARKSNDNRTGNSARTSSKSNIKVSAGGKNAKGRTAGRKSAVGKTAGIASQEREQSEFRASEDVKIISGFVVMILLMLSNFHLIGRAGNIISRFLFGMFGLFAYIVPVLAFIAVCFFVANIDNKTAMKKLVAAVVLYVMVSTILQLIYSSTEVGFHLGSIYKACRRIRNGGGFVGGLFAVLLHSIIGTYGAYIVVFAITIVCLVIISEKSFVNGVKRRSRDAYASAREDVKRMKENSDLRSRQRKKSRQLVRANKPVRGVALNPKVTEGTEVDADVHELIKNGALYRGHINYEDDTTQDFLPGKLYGNEEAQEESSDVLYASRVHSNIEYSNTEYLDTGYLDAEEYDGGYTDGGAGDMALPDEAEDFGDTIVPDIHKIWSDRAQADVVSRAEEEARDKDIRAGEFQPKEKIVVSKAAKEVMNRKAFSGTSLSISNSVPVPDVNEGIEKKAVSPQQAAVRPKSKEYVMPPLTLLRKGKGFKSGSMKNGQISQTAIKLQQTLEAFGVRANVINESRGPSVTRYELQPETGTKVSKITALSDDIKLNLAASDIRIEAPIPGKAAVGIEVPNDKRESVFLRDLIESEELSKHPSRLAFAAGMDIAGKVVVADIAKMPHMLIAGTTGSGKSVFTNSIIMSILFRAKPSEVKLIIVDPKVVEFGVYNGIPHLLSPVVTDPRKAAGALNWAVGEMSERYKLFANYNVRDLKGYNEKIKQMGYMDGDEWLQPKPQIVIIIDELADLMMVASKEVEAAICRLAQLARAAGIHLIIATQRPSVDVVTGLIKANIPSRVALLVSSGTDSRTIIDSNGGEKLLGNGDMLFYPSGYVKPVRLQGAFVSDEEVQNVVKFLIDNNQDVEYNEAVTNTEPDMDNGETSSQGNGDDKDVLFEQAARFVIEKEKGSTSMLQRMFKIGFNRAARIIDQLEKAGIVGADEGTKPRKVLMTMEEFEQTL